MTNLELICLISVAVFLISGTAVFSAAASEIENKEGIVLPFSFIGAIAGITAAVTGAVLLICEIIKVCKLS